MLLTRWLTSTIDRTPCRKAATKLSLDMLETRENPSLTIQIDYRFDNGYFTNNTDPNAAVRRTTIEQAARDIGSHITTPLAAIQPGGSNSWTATVFNPANPQSTVSVPGLAVGANTIVVFVSGGTGSGGEAGLGGYGGYSASGSSAWLASLRNRGPSGPSGFTTWGGAVSFDQSTNWNFGLGSPASNQLDFYTVSTHELTHVLGFGTSPTWNNKVSNGVFTGAFSVATYGAGVPVSGSADAGHWRQGTIYNGSVTVMQPELSHGKRVAASKLEYAALADTGWQVTGFNSTAAVTAAPPTTTTSTSTPVSASVAPTTTSPITSGYHTKPKAFAVSTTTGSVQQFNGVGGVVNPVSGSFDPYPGFTGSIRTSMADVTRDGVPDLITAPGAGGGPLVKVFDGSTGALVTQFFAFESYFTGGVFVASGDFDHDGRADIVVGADSSGGPRVRVLSGYDLHVITDFYGIADPDFRGGVRVAVGDLNGDGTVDLVVAAGAGGAPRVAIYDGRTLSMWAPPTRLTGDFYAFEMNLTNGSYVAIGDVNGDGFGDLVLGAGEGGGPRVKVLSGKTLTQNGPAAALDSALKDYFTGDPMSGSGVRVAATDVDGDGKAEVIATSGIYSRAHVNISGMYWGTSSDLAGGQVLRNGVFVG